MYRYLWGKNWLGSGQTCKYMTLTKRICCYRSLFRPPDDRVHDFPNFLSMILIELIEIFQNIYRHLLIRN